jgi:hypothetical protein
MVVAPERVVYGLVCADEFAQEKCRFFGGRSIVELLPHQPIRVVSLTYGPRLVPFAEFVHVGEHVL